MHLSSLLTASALLLAAQAAPSAHQSTTVTFRVPASAALANPFSLAPATHATLTTAGQRTLSAPLTTANAFVFHNVTPGSYLVDVHAPTHVFAPLRLDVLAESDGDGHGATPVEGKGKGLILRAWDTYRANDWDNKGEAVALAEGNVFDVSAVAPKNYFAERSTFSVLSILRQPMILMGLVSMGIFFGMPYLVNNMDPEMRAEYEARNKEGGVLNNILGSGGGSQAAAQPNPAANFDLAGFLAGSAPKESGGSSSVGTAATPGGGSKKKK